MKTKFAKFFILNFLIAIIPYIKISAQAKEWIVFDTLNSQLPDDYVSSIVFDKNNVKWIGTDAGIISIDGNNWTLYDSANGDLPNDNIYSIAVDQNNNIWAGTDHGLAKFDGSRWTNYNTSNSLIPYDTLVYIAIDNTNNLWIGTDNFGLIKFDGSTWTSYTIDNSNIPDNSVWTINFNSGKILLGTDYGFTSFDGTSTWTDINSDNSNLPNDEVLSLGIDKNNIKWFGTDSGLVKLSGIQMVSYFTTNSQLPGNVINFINVDDSYNKWFCTDGGIAEYNNSSWSIFDTLNSGLPSNFTTCTKIDNQGNQWIATDAGLAVYRAGGVIGIDNPDKLPPVPDSLKLTENDCYLKLSWNSNPDTNIFNRIYRSTSSGGNYTLIADSIYDTVYYDINVQPNVTYYYVVSAVSDINKKESSYSKEVFGKAIRGGLAPLPPDSVNIEEVSDELYLSWQYDIRDSNTFFKIYRSTISGKNYSLIADSLYDNEYDDTTVVAGTTYYYVFTTTNEIVKKESGFSKEVSGKLNSAPEPPIPPDSLVLTTNKNKIILNWKYEVNPNIIFRVYRSDQSGINYSMLQDSIITLTYSDTNLIPQKIYYYVIRAFDKTSQLESSNSNEVSGGINVSDVQNQEASNNNIINTNSFFLNPFLIIKIESGNFDNNEIKLNLYDIFGRAVYTETKVLNTEQNETEFQINFSYFSSGVYFYTLESGTNSETGKIEILK